MNYSYAIFYLFIVLSIFPHKGLSQGQENEILKKGDNFYANAIRFSNELHLDSAVFYYQKAINIYEREQDWDGAVISYSALTSTMLVHGKYDLALSNIESTFEKYMKSEFEISEQSKLLLYIEYAESAQAIGDLVLAEKQISEAFAILENPLYKVQLSKQEARYYNPANPEAKAYFALASIEYEGNQYKIALQYIEKAIQLFETSSSKQSLAYTLSCYNLKGLILKELNRFSDALDCFNNVLKRKNSFSNFEKFSASYLYNNIGYTKWQYGKYYYRGQSPEQGRLLFDEASEAYEMSIKYWKDIFKEHPIYARTINNYAMVYDDLYIYEKDTLAYKYAHELYIESLEMKENILPPRHGYIARNYMNIGALYYEGKEYTNALEYLNKVLELQIVDFNTKNIDALPELANVLDHNKVLYSLKKRAQVYFDRYIHFSKDIKDLNLALSNYELSIDLISQIRHSYKSEDAKQKLSESEFTVLENGISIAQLLFEKTKDREFLERSLLLIERMKSIILFEIISNNKALAISKIPDTLLQREKQIRRSLVQFESEIYETNVLSNQDSLLRGFVEAQRKYYELIAKLENDYPGYHNLKYGTTPVTLEKIKKEILKNNSESIMIEYLLGNEIIYIIGVTIDNIYLHTLPKKDVIDDLKGFNKMIRSNPYVDESQNTDTLIEKSNFLYGKLVKPILDSIEISTIKKLIIIPDGLLNYISFDALVVNTSPNLEYLIDEYQLSYGYSASLLMAKDGENKNQAFQNKYVGFAPVFPSLVAASTRGCNNSLDRLPFSEQEIRETSEIIDSGDVYFENATRQNFLNSLGSYQIYHLSTHACVDDSVSLQNRIYFTPNDNGEELDYLTVKELYNLSIDGELAVLSACNTGDGDLLKGEGIVSLARGVTVAGCPSVVTSLWEANESSSAEIIVDFFSYLKKGQEKDEALRNAKLNYLRSNDGFSDPYFWAGFIHIGNSDAIFENSDNSYVFLVVCIGLILALILFYRTKTKKNS